MAMWVKCTEKHGQAIYLNMDNATMIFRDDNRSEGTEVIFVGSGSTVVRETVEQILRHSG